MPQVIFRSSSLTTRLLRYRLSSWPPSSVTATAAASDGVERCWISSKKDPPLTDAELQEFKQNEARIKQELQNEAAFLTKSLYRTCLRSVRLIRPGNENDEAEFEERETKRKEEELSFSSRGDNEDVRMGMFSMLPPVDREDELRSRAEYYHQYARENLVQETDCLPLRDDSIGRLRADDVQRFVFLLKKGEKDRQWLLQDMQFSDPYQKNFPKDLTRQFEDKAMEYVGKSELVRRKVTGEDTIIWDEDLDDGDDDDDDTEDPFEDADAVPHWVREKYPHLAPRQR